MERPAYVAIAAVLIFAVAAPALEHLAHVPRWASSDLVQFSGLMAAIFTAGGLIVALVSIFTLFNVRQVVKQAVGSALEDVTDKFELRMQSYVSAYAFLNAAQQWWQNARFAGLPQVESLIEQAEEAEPNLLEARDWSGILYLKIARHLYLQKKAVISRTPIDDLPLEDIPHFARLAIPRLSMMLEKRKQPAARAFYASQVAQAAALLGDRPSSIARQLRATRPTDGFAPLKGIGAFSLLASCRHGDDVDEILEAYGHESLTAETLGAHLAALAESQTVEAIVAVARDPRFLQECPAGPFLVKVKTTERRQNGALEWLSEREAADGVRRVGGIPPFGPFNDETKTYPMQGYTPIRDLLSEAFAKLVLVVPYDYVESNW